MSMWWIVISLIVAGVAGVLVPLELGRRDGRRWGFRRTAQRVDPSPYRGATVHREDPRSAPWLVRLAAGLNVAWGLLTLLIFAPAGCLLFLLAGEAPFFVLALVPVVLGGFVLGLRLVGAGGDLLKQHLDRLPGTIRWSVLHHLAVSALFGIGGTLLLPREPVVGLIPSVPAGVGLALALLLAWAHRRVIVLRAAGTSRTS